MKRRTAAGADSTASLRFEGLLTRREVADILRVHVCTIDQLCARGDLERVKLGAVVRIRPESLRRLLGEVVGVAR